jgi:hypothetical protein
MEQISFREKIVALRDEFIHDRYNNNRTQDFWYVMDSFNDEEILKWALRAGQIKTPAGEPWTPDEWLKLCNILTYMKHRDPMNELPWTKAQKRFCTFMIIKFWDDLEMMYFC